MQKKLEEFLYKTNEYTECIHAMKKENRGGSFNFKKDTLGSFQEYINLTLHGLGVMPNLVREDYTPGMALNQDRVGEETCNEIAKGLQLWISGFNNFCKNADEYKVPQLIFFLEIFLKRVCQNINVYDLGPDILYQEEIKYIFTFKKEHGILAPSEFYFDKVESFFIVYVNQLICIIQLAKN